MGRKQIVVAGAFGATLGGAVLIQAGSDTNGDGFLEFADGEIITADDMNTNFTRASDHITRYENAVMLNTDDNVGLGGLPLDDESLYIFQDETGTGSHLNLHLEKNEGGDMLQLSDGLGFDLHVGIDADDDFGYLGTTGFSQTLVLRAGAIGIGTYTPTNSLQIGTLSGSHSDYGLAVSSSIYGALIQTASGNTSGALRVITNGSNIDAFRVQNDGKVGIGTATPGTKLDIAGTVFSRVSSLSVGSESRLNFYAPYIAGETENTGMIAGIRGEINTTSPLKGDLAFRVNIGNNSSEAMRLTNTGRLGIGTSAPQTTLDINGGIRAFEICDEAGANCKDISSGWGTSSQWITSGSSIYYSSGNVGIGTSSPEQKLHVSEGHIRASSTSTHVGTILDSASGFNAFLDLYEAGSKKSNVYFNGSLDKFYINDASIPSSVPIVMATNGGSVGIGTDTPAARLHVLASAGTTALKATEGNVSFYFDEESNAHGNFIIQNLNSGGRQYSIRNRNEGRLDFRDDSAGVERITIASSGYVGIGTTSPSAKVHIQDASSPMIMQTDTGNTKTWWTRFNGGGANYVIGTSTDTSDANIKVSIHEGGDVGIGVTSPGYKLHVNGQVGATGFITTSDARLKHDIAPIENALEGIQCLAGVTYYWNDSALSPRRQLGLIAQDVEACFPDAISERPDGVKGVFYSQLVAPLIEAVKELAQRMEGIEGELLEYQGQVDDLESRVKIQQNRLEVFSAQNSADQHRISALESQVRDAEARAAATEARLAAIERSLDRRR